MSAIAELGLKADGFIQGIQQASQSLQSFQSLANTTADKDALPTNKTKTAAQAIAVAVALASAAMVKGTEQAVQFGSALVDLSYSEGLAVKQTMALNLAVANYGITTEEVASATSKFNGVAASAANGVGPLVGVLSKASIKMQDFAKMDVAARMQTTAAAIKMIQNPAEKAAAAMAIWGKEGLKLNEALQPGKVTSAAAALGSQADLMEKNAGMFARISQTMAESGSALSEITAGAKQRVQGFFVGVASSIAPEILSLMDSLNSGASNIGETIKKMVPALGPLVDFANKIVAIDFAEQGRQFGRAIAIAVEQLRSLNLGDLLKGKITTITKEEAAAKVDAIAADQIGKNPTPLPETKVLAPTVFGSGKIDMAAGLSSLAKIGGAYGGISGGATTDQAAWETVRIQTDIRSYMQQLLQAVKQAPQELGITTGTSGMVLSA